MPSHKSNRSGQIDTHRKNRLSNKSSSFHSHNAMTQAAAELRRPRTLPDLISYRNAAVVSPEVPPRQPPKILLKVTLLGSVAPVQLLMRPESTVGDLISAAVSQFVREGRRPVLPTDEPSGFNLHYSQFSLESLNREGKLIELGSRSFFLCPRKVTQGGAAVEGGVTKTYASCAEEAGKVREVNGGGAFGWFKLMHFML
ncbi:hypothetical protein HN51_043037 [Arachis hypogaea]|uniref:DUF7054 domain-containing protein n=1 Tax=Arachis hypogaea TaxID=3818 RepID=A0A444Y7I3_ARAHY|nr:uncharacterized protein At4g22758 [Arachis ipaensis]XP_025673088.1 uncharacterized protein At4g22758 [Arachis hypogaea]QHN95154.1 uncharacterized protein DS421_18g607090 [Arachis hypogaea]RYQ97889.1 hypothetical protein Ahy_B08g093967 [Arachis hypogaea]